MHQDKFDVAEFLINNKKELFDMIKKEIQDVAVTEYWWSQNGLLESFNQAFEDFVVYKLKWLTVEQLNMSFDAVSDIIDKGFIVDLFSEDVLKSGYWIKE